LFQKLPGLRVIHDLRWNLTGIFDSAPDRDTAEAEIAAWRAEAENSGLDWSKFLGLYYRHSDGILAYFARRESSGPVEGLNNKARVILKRSYGLKSCETLWTRLILDLNRAKEIVLYTIRQIRELVRGLRAIFACT